MLQYIVGAPFVFCRNMVLFNVSYPHVYYGDLGGIMYVLYEK